MERGAEGQCGAVSVVGAGMKRVLKIVTQGGPKKTGQHDFILSGFIRNPNNQKPKEKDDE